MLDGMEISLGDLDNIYGSRQLKDLEDRIKELQDQASTIQEEFDIEGDDYIDASGSLQKNDEYFDDFEQDEFSSDAEIVNGVEPPVKEKDQARFISDELLRYYNSPRVEDSGTSKIVGEYNVDIDETKVIPTVTFEKEDAEPKGQDEDFDESQVDLDDQESLPDDIEVDTFGSVSSTSDDDEDSDEIDVEILDDDTVTNFEDGIWNKDDSSFDGVSDNGSNSWRSSDVDDEDSETDIDFSDIDLDSIVDEDDDTSGDFDNTVTPSTLVSKIDENEQQEQSSKNSVISVNNSDDTKKDNNLINSDKESDSDLSDDEDDLDIDWGDDEYDLDITDADNLADEIQSSESMDKESDARVAENQDADNDADYTGEDDIDEDDIESALDDMDIDEDDIESALDDIDIDGLDDEELVDEDNESNNVDDEDDIDSEIDAIDDLDDIEGLDDFEEDEVSEPTKGIKTSNKSSSDLQTSNHATEATENVTLQEQENDADRSVDDEVAELERKLTEARKRKALANSNRSDKTVTNPSRRQVNSKESTRKIENKPVEKRNAQVNDRRASKKPTNDNSLEAQKKRAEQLANEMRAKKSRKAGVYDGLPQKSINKPDSSLLSEKSSKNNNVNSPPRRKLTRHEKYAQLTDERLMAYVSEFLKRNGVAKKPVDRRVLDSEFGQQNISKLIKRSYLISIGKGITLGI